MPLRPDLLYEVPPTAGLPLQPGDFLPPFNKNLAAQAADFLGVPTVQIECSGTASLIVALLTLKRLSKRRTVVVPAYTCPLVALAIAHCGLHIRLCDLTPENFDMDPVMLRAVCDSDTLAIVPTHLAGRVADVEESNSCARRVGAWVIEDAAQAFGARLGGVSVGLLGDIGFFSLAVGKGLTIYEGGLLVAKGETLRSELRRTSAEVVQTNAVWEFKRALQLIGYYALYRPSGLGLAYGLPLRRALRRGDHVAAVGDDFSSSIPVHRVGNWRQSIGARALVRLPAFQNTLSLQVRARASRLRGLSGVTIMDDAPGAHGAWPLLMLKMPSAEARDAVLAELWGAGLGVSRLFINALPDYRYLSGIVTSANVPNARAFAARTLTISNSSWLTDSLFERVLRVLESVTETAS